MYITIKKQKQGELIVNQANWIGFCDNWNLLVPEMKFLVHKVQAKRSLQTSFLALNRHAASAGCREEGRSTYVATVRLKDPPENQNPPSAGLDFGNVTPREASPQRPQTPRAAMLSHKQPSSISLLLPCFTSARTFQWLRQSSSCRFSEAAPCSLRNIRSRCLLVPGTRDSPPSGSRTRSRAEELPRPCPGPLGRWRSRGCQTPARWSLRRC